MHILLAGGSGFLGRALGAVLARDGHRLSVLTRRPRPGHTGDIAWTPDGAAGPWARALDGVDAIVNLAGEGIAERRWTASRKVVLVSTRLLATQSLVAAVAAMATPPAAFVSASGVGYYGPCGDEVVTEATAAGHDFVGRMASAWEAAAAPVASHCRLVVLRTGLVMGREGALAQMRLPFSLGVGGRLGSGRQWMPWVAVDDWTGLTARLIVDPRASGPFNVTAPAPVTNAEFTRALGRALHRPAVIPVPAFALRLAVGELAEALLTGQRAIPAKALDLGYAFRHTSIETALASALG